MKSKKYGKQFKIEALVIAFVLLMIGIISIQRTIIAENKSDSQSSFVSQSQAKR